MEQQSQPPSVNQSLGTASNAMRDVGRSFGQKAREAITGTGGKSVTIVAVIVVILLAIWVTLFVIKRIRNANRINKPVLSSRFQALDEINSLPVMIPSKKLPATSNGNEQTYEFWLYLSDNFDVTTHYKVVFARDTAQQASGYVSQNAGPVVVLDRNINKLLVGAATKAATGGRYSLNEVFDAPNSAFLKTYVESIPLQKWTHLVIVLVDNEMRLYVDGQLYSVVSTHELPNTPMLSVNDGNIYIGDKTNTARGYLAGFRYYNHVLPHRKVRSNYSRGPANKNWMRWFGLQQYGLRAPIYKAD